MKQLSLILLIVLPLFISAQSESEIHANNIRTRMNSTGRMFWDGNNGTFQVPYTDFGSPTVIFAGGIWVGGIDPVGNLKVASMTYEGVSDSPYAPGPYDVVAPDYDFNRVWRVTGAEIRAHRADAADGTIDDPIPSSILDWPAGGNSGLENIEGDRLAAFMDVNGDFQYDAASGDYPVVIVDGQPIVPDDMIYTIYHPKDENDAPNFDIHSTLYGFAGEEDDIVAHSLFMQQKLISVETEQLTDFRFSYWIDADVGCHTDDYIGCDTSRNAMIAYNADDEDGESGDCGSTEIYEDPPVLSLTLLNQSMTNFSYFNNRALGADASTADPTNILEHYNYMGSIWPDGTPLTSGGNGYDPSSTDFTNYAFTGDPTMTTEWSMLSESIPKQYDPRTLTTNSQETFSPGQILTYDAVINFTNCPGYLEDLPKAKENIDHLQELYDNGFQGVTQVIDSKFQVTNVEIYPNPNQGRFQIDSEHQFDTYTILDLEGKQVSSGTVPADNSITLNMVPGSYFIQLLEKEGRFYQGKIVIVK